MSRGGRSSRHEKPGGVELRGRRDRRRFCRSTRRSANRPGLCATFQRGAVPHHCHTTLLSYPPPPHLSDTHLHLYSFPFALSTKTCLTRKHYSTESKELQANGSVWKVHQTVFFFSDFFLLPRRVLLLIMLSVQVYGEK